KLWPRAGAVVTKAPAATSTQLLRPNTLCIGIFIGSISLGMSGSTPKTLMGRQLFRKVLLQLLIGSCVQMQVILVDINHLDAWPFALDGERVTRLDGLSVINRAFPVAMMQLSRTDQWIEPRRINGILNPFRHDLHVVAEFFVDIGNTTRDVGHG